MKRRDFLKATGLFSVAPFIKSVAPFIKLEQPPAKDTCTLLSLVNKQPQLYVIMGRPNTGREEIAWQLSKQICTNKNSYFVVSKKGAHWSNSLDWKSLLDGSGLLEMTNGCDQWEERYKYFRKLRQLSVASNRNGIVIVTSPTTIKIACECNPSNFGWIRPVDVFIKTYPSVPPFLLKSRLTKSLVSIEI